jgi:CBS domain-containing protein
MKAAEVMTPCVATCRVDQTAEDAARLMWDHDCGVVPVIDQDGSLKGVVTDRDLLMASQMQGKRPSELRLSALVPGPVETCREDDDVQSVLAKMADRQIRRVPIVDKGRRLVGIVSINDLALKALGNDQQMKNVAKTLAEIGRHRSANACAAPK